MSSYGAKKEKIEKIKDKKKEKDIYKGLKNNKQGRLLENKKYIFEPIWKIEADGYFCRFKRYCSYATKKQKIKQKNWLKKSTFHIQLIVEIFLVQKIKNNFF